MATQKADATIQVDPVRQETIRVGVIGTRPLINNRMSEKARHELLFPSPRKNAAQRQSTLKHNPLEEFRASPYLLPEGEPSLIGLMSSAFKRAMMTAALDLPGTAKAQIGRLVWVEGDLTPIYGVPQLFMAITRQADTKHTPDVRTRAIIPQWATLVTISYVVPLMNERSVVNLLAAGGITSGVGDWRTEKGAGTFGQFKVTSDDDPEVLAIIKSGGRAAQAKAMEKPTCYDTETAELLEWFDGAATKSGKLKVA
jgi:hypothetical protein